MQAVIQSVRELGSNPIVFDMTTLEQGDYRWAPDAAEFSAYGERVSLTWSEHRRGWIRRVTPDDWRTDVTPRSLEGVVRAAWSTLLVAVLHGPGIDWVTPVSSILVSENKAIQYLRARQLGIPIPQTVIAGTSDLVPPALGAPIVAKPLGPSTYVEDGATFTVHTEAIERSEADLAGLGEAPFLLQQLIAARTHLRIVTCLDKAWVFELDARDHGLDWRLDDEAHSAFVATTDHAKLRESAIRLAHSCGARFSSQDWVVNDHGQPFFLDLNPGGQWLFLPDPQAGQITGRLAGWLGEAVG